MEKENLSSKTLFLVEDDQLTFLFVQQVFKKSELNIIRASSGNEALEIANLNKNFDCILVDIQLPDITGYDVIEELKSFYPETPIVAQTASRSVEAKNLAIEKGATNFIFKPYRANELLNFVTDLITC